MDLRQIEYMLAIEQEESISRAAARLFITQSALNQQLLKLEKELGTPLFERKKHAMLPTYAGSIYLDTARQMVDLKERAYKKIHDIAEENSGEISLVFTPEKGADMFTQVFPRFHSRYPNIRFKVHEGRNKSMEQMLMQKEVDFAVAVYAPGLKNPHLEYWDMEKEEMVMIVPASHSLAHLAGPRSYETLPTVDLKLFAEDVFVLPSKETLLSDMVDRLLKNNNLQITPLFESSSTSSVIRMVKNQLCLGFVPGHYVKEDPDLVYFRVKPCEYWIRSIVMRPGTYITTAEQYLFELVRLNSIKRSSLGMAEERRIYSKDSML